MSKTRDDNPSGGGRQEDIDRTQSNYQEYQHGQQTGEGTPVLDDGLSKIPTLIGGAIGGVLGAPFGLAGPGAALGATAGRLAGGQSPSDEASPPKFAERGKVPGVDCTEAMSHAEIKSWSGQTKTRND